MDDSKKSSVCNDETIDSVKLSRLEFLNYVEKERERIASDIHDSPVQDLVAISHKIEYCMKIFDSDPVSCRLELATMSNSIKEVISSMRDIIYDLKPMSISDLGLTETLERVSDKISNDFNIPVFFTNHLTITEKLDDLININIFRSVRECVINAAKYSMCSCINVTLLNDKKYVIAIVNDDGVGFSDSSVKEAKYDGHGMGLELIGERVQCLHGKFEIKSSNNGTEITLKIPIKLV